MTLLRPTLLVLAWDDADPAAGGPAVLPVVRALAEYQPVLALLPHLPEGARHVPTHELPASPPPAPEYFLDHLPETPAAELEFEADEPTTEPVFEAETEAEAVAAQGAETAWAIPEENISLAVETVESAPSSDLATLLDPGQNHGLRVVGLGDLSPAELAEVGVEVIQPPVEVAMTAPLATSSIPTVAPVSTPPLVVTPKVSIPAKTEVILRPPLAEKRATAWQEPAAPYVGNTTAAEPTPSIGVAESAAVAATQPPSPETRPEPESTPQLDSLIADELPAQPVTAAVVEAVVKTAPQLPSPQPAALPDDQAHETTDLPLDEADFSDFGTDEKASVAEPEFLAEEALTEEILDETGPAEARELAEPIPEPTPPQEPAPPQTPARATLTDALASLRQPAAVVPVYTGPSPFEHADALHYRVIQYARFASYLAANETAGFEAIYAPSWPTWLAAVEIGYRHRRPLVLHLSALAIDEATPAGRGWLLELERSTLRRAHTVLVATETLRERVLAHYELLTPKQVQVVALDDVEGVQTALAAATAQAQLLAALVS